MPNLLAHELENLILHLVVVHERRLAMGKLLRHLQSPLDLSCNKRGGNEDKAIRIILVRSQKTTTATIIAYLEGKSRSRPDSTADVPGFAKWAASVRRIRTGRGYSSRLEPAFPRSNKDSAHFSF